MGARQQPDARGYFGTYGGQFVPETLVPALDELEREYREARKDPSFHAELDAYLADYAGRPTPLYRARRLGDRLGGLAVYLKREDLAHGGAHKINNTLGQALLAKRMGKRRLIAETGAGQHGVATALTAALFGMECDVYMGEEDMRRQALNVFRMRLMGTRVIRISSGSKTLKDATSAALRDWMASVEHTHYIIGSVVGPHPFPMIVRDFQAVIGRESRAQILEKEERLPDVILACIGGGSNAAGMFSAFLGDKQIELIGIEAGGEGLDSGRYAATLVRGQVGVLHGSLSYVLQDSEGQTLPVHSISAGLDYPGVGPEHSFLKDSGRVRYETATDEEAVKAFRLLSETEGIIPALEPAHAIAYLARSADRFSKDALILLCLSGGGDKDCVEVARLIGEGDLR